MEPTKRRVTFLYTLILLFALLLVIISVTANSNANSLPPSGPQPALIQDFHPAGSGDLYDITNANVMSTNHTNVAATPSA